MANDQKKMVDSITSMDEDFAKWYTDVCKKAELVSYTSVKGCMVIRPYGYAIWENIQRILDGMFKELGHENVNIQNRHDKFGNSFNSLFYSVIYDQCSQKHKDQSIPYRRRRRDK